MTFLPVVLATRHGKEIALRKSLRKLGYQVIVLPDFPSDQFGTFTREIPRPDTQLGTARLKALAAAEQAGLSRAVASEGAFGPHPVVPFVPLARELVLFVDLENGYEVQGWKIGGKTNFRSRTVSSVPEAESFCQEVGFPSHAVVASETESSDSLIQKGIQSWESVTSILSRFSQGVLLETDMRAMVNPTRMKRIEEAGLALCANFQSICPSCQAPGWHVVRVERGLPCEWCAAKTDMVRVEIYGCSRCKSEAKKEKETYANSTYCQLCNP